MISEIIYEYTQATLHCLACGGDEYQNIVNKWSQVVWYNSVTRFESVQQTDHP